MTHTQDSTLITPPHGAHAQSNYTGSLEQPPFEHPKFKPKSRYNPPGPKDLEHYIARNELL